MNWLSRFDNLRIWVRLVAVILVGTISAGAGLVYWATLQQKKIAVDQARDFAQSVHQMTMAGLTGMMITGSIAQRSVFLDQIRDSNHIEALKVLRGHPLVLRSSVRATPANCRKPPPSAPCWIAASRISR